MVVLQGITISWTRNPPEEWLFRQESTREFLPEITSSLRRNPPKKWDSARNKMLIRFRLVRSKCTKNPSTDKNFRICILRKSIFYKYENVIKSKIMTQPLYKLHIYSIKSKKRSSKSHETIPLRKLRLYTKT
jgi:hypothetical protein